MIENVAEYIHLELAVLVPVLYFLGLGIRTMRAEVKNSIPLILMGIGVVLASLWVLGSNPISLQSVFTAITQGIICAGMAVFGHEIIKKVK